MKIKKSFLMSFIAVLVAVTISSGTTATAQTTVVVTRENEQGFSETTLAGGKVTFVVDPVAPLGRGALRLTTDSNPESYAAYFNETNTRLAEIDQLSYFTKRNGGPAIADSAFALVVNLAPASGQSFLIYEPYLQQPSRSSGVTGQFAFQDVANGGLLYSNREVQCEGGVVSRGAPGDGPFYTSNQIKTLCPNAVVTDFGVFIGTFNVNYDVEVDLLNFDGTIFDFEPSGNDSRPKNAEDCKKGGFRTNFNPPFRNQGQCVSSFNSRKKMMVNR